ncbi:hypothetical protein [Rhizobium sp. RAF56]|uniref:hypothetical protein n=1 Tax=Rhizobium sp. RAF56 TaxID=3233062 RepID=UPI003F9AC242
MSGTSPEVAAVVTINVDRRPLARTRRCGVRANGLGFPGGVSVDLLESFVAKPHDGAGADYVALFRKHSDQPFERKGRIADHRTVMNIFNDAKPDPMQLDAQRPETTCSARAEAERTRIEFDQAKSQVAELQAARTLAEMELGAIKSELGALNSSAVWRFMSSVRRLSKHYSRKLRENHSGGGGHGPWPQRVRTWAATEPGDAKPRDAGGPNLAG